MVFPVKGLVRLVFAMKECRSKRVWAFPTWRWICFGWDETSWSRKLI